MKKSNFLVCCLLLVSLLFVACEKDDEVKMTRLNLTTSLTTDLSGLDLGGLAVEITSLTSSYSTKTTTSAEGALVVDLEEGIYSIKISGEKRFTAAENSTQTVFLRGVLENLSLTGAELNQEIPLLISVANAGWVIKEIYFTGSKKPTGGTYYKDKYFELYNNSEEVLYADGIAIAESDHNTSSEVNTWVSSGNNNFVAQAIYTIPGNGTTYPVQPGQSVVIADVAIDHRVDNANSFDLSKADFEWYDNNKLDVDVPEVANMIKSFSYSASIWTPHNRGFNSYVIFRPEAGMEAFLEANRVERVTASGTVVYRYQIADQYILDAVELGTPTDFKSKALSAALDLGYTHSGDGDDARYGKCVRRKVLLNQNGRVVYQDTNNSEVDFLPTVDPQPKQFN